MKDHTCNWSISVGYARRYWAKGAAMNRKILFLTLVLVLLALPLAAAARPVYPAVIPLQNGLTPEGITGGKGHTFYYGTLTGGAIFRGNYRTGDIEPLVAPDPSRIAVGMAFDQRSGLLYVAGGFFGTARVYNVADGSQVAAIQLASPPPLPPPFITWINDVTITRNAVYFTDSFQATIYRVPLGAAGFLPDPPQVEPIPLSGEFVLEPQPTPPDFIINANGIVATPDDRWLLIVNSFDGRLYRVDPGTGYAREIDLGGLSVPTGDGLVLHGQTLYVVQNINQISVIKLAADFASGTVTDILANDAFRVPTTAALFGNALYAVNARFDQIDPFNPPPDAEFEAVRVEINP
jgi:sugar lactone lactonase YvrE